MSGLKLFDRGGVLAIFATVMCFYFLLLDLGRYFAELELFKFCFYRFIILLSDSLWNAWKYNDGPGKGGRIRLRLR